MAARQEGEKETKVPLHNSCQQQMCMRSPVNSILHKKSIKEGRKRKRKDKKKPKMYSDGPLFSPMRSLSLLSVDFHKAFIILLIPNAELFLVNSPVSLSDPVVVSFSKVLPNPHVCSCEVLKGQPVSSLTPCG